MSGLLVAQTQFTPQEGWTAIALLAILVILIANELRVSWGWKRRFVDRLETEKTEIAKEKDEAVESRDKIILDVTTKFNETVNNINNTVLARLNEVCILQTENIEDRRVFQEHVKEEHGVLMENNKMMMENQKKVAEAIDKNTEVLAKMCKHLEVKLNGDSWNGEERRGSL